MGGGPGVQGELNVQANRALLSLSEALEDAKVGFGACGPVDRVLQARSQGAGDHGQDYLHIIIKGPVGVHNTVVERRLTCGCTQVRVPLAPTIVRS